MSDIKKIKHDAVNGLVKLKFVINLLLEQSDVGMEKSEIINRGDEALKEFGLCWEEIKQHSQK